MLSSGYARHMPPLAAAAVDVGQRFVEVGGEHGVVQVVAVIRPQAGHPHARLRRTGKTSGVTLVSCAALRDPRSFLPLGESRDPGPLLIPSRLSDALPGAPRPAGVCGGADRPDGPVRGPVPLAPAGLAARTAWSSSGRS